MTRKPILADCLADLNASSPHLAMADPGSLQRADLLTKILALRLRWPKFWPIFSATRWVLFIGTLRNC